jgi:hypothetical protein
MDRNAEFRRINDERDEAERASWREYRNALQDYNAALRAAYNKHHDNLERIEADWREKLERVA